MTRKQCTIIACCAAANIALCSAILLLFHAPIGLPFDLMIGITFAAGSIQGTLQEKWRRDKQMSQIVAERLLRKPEIASDPQMNTGGLAQGIQMAAMNQSGHFSSFLGSPTISQGAQSKLSGKQC